MGNSKAKTFLIWVGLIALFVFLLSRANKRQSPPTGVTFEVFQQALDTGDIASYSFEGHGIQFERRSIPGSLRVLIDWQSDQWSEEVTEKLENSGAVYNFEPQNESGLSQLLTYLIVGAVALLLLIFLLRRFGGGAQQNIFALRTSKARLADESNKVRFDDVGGCSEAKLELSDIVNYLKSPQRWSDAGARLPRGVLLEGPPGCGKTLLAQAVAGETNAKFYYTSGSEFVEMFIGVGPARVRDMFDTAKKEAPAVMFIDELDAIGRRRGSGVGFANEEREQTLNQILVCMDGFESTDSVVVIAATNRADILDRALVRAGRFDRRIRIDSLGADERATVLKIHTKDKQLAADTSLEEVAALTEGFTGADLETLTNLAALLAVRRTANTDTKAKVTTEDFRLALEKRQNQDQSKDALDAVLLEATTQLAEPVARAVVKITLMNDTIVAGDVVWIDPNFIKVRRESDGSTFIVPKNQISHMEALDGTESVSNADVQIDRSLGSGPNFA